MADRARHRPGLLATGGLALVALLYTTPWDNYLVANGIWSYDPARVSGITFGWVPLEEYLFFVLQPLATGLWTLTVLRRSAPVALRATDRRWLRAGSLLLLAALWSAALPALVRGLQPWRYLALILIWALPPLALQFAYGAPQLWRRRGLALLAVLPPTIYLAAADALAIQQGVWTISPAYSLGVVLLRILPLEEFLFFLLTNCLIAFALILLAPRLHLARSPQAP